jgi:alpha-beta hydrolase superfamily lysophospholipase
MKPRILSHSFPVEQRAFMTELMPGTERFINRWQPLRQAPSAIVTIIHGLGDHGGRFAQMANSLASAGVAVLAVDLIGHGLSPGRRGVISSFDSLLDEVGNATYLGSRYWPTVPSFVVGQSMGGNLVLNWSMRRPFEAKKVNGIVAMAPMLRMARSPSPNFLKVGKWLEKRFPNIRLGTPVDVRQLCSDPLGQDAYLRDRLVHRKMSLRLGLSLIESGQWILDNAELLQKPTLLMHGCDDTLTCPLATEELASKACNSTTLRLWNHCRHDLHFELQRESVVAFLFDWMRRQGRKTGYRITKIDAAKAA